MNGTTNESVGTVGRVGRTGEKLCPAVERVVVA
jgi:hypothetical protein